MSYLGVSLVHWCGTVGFYRIISVCIGICVSFAIVVFESIFSAVRGPVVQSTESEKLALQSTAEEVSSSQYF